MQRFVFFAILLCLTLPASGNAATVTNALGPQDTSDMAQAGIADSAPLVLALARAPTAQGPLVPPVPDQLLVPDPPRSYAVIMPRPRGLRLPDRQVMAHYGVIMVIIFTLRLMQLAQWPFFKLQRRAHRYTRYNQLLTRRNSA